MAIQEFGIAQQGTEEDEKRKRGETSSYPSLTCFKLDYKGLSSIILEIPKNEPKQSTSTNLETELKPNTIRLLTYKRKSGSKLQ